MVGWMGRLIIGTCPGQIYQSTSVILLPVPVLWTGGWLKPCRQLMLLEHDHWLLKYPLKRAPAVTSGAHFSGYFAINNETSTQNHGIVTNVMSFMTGSIVRN